MKKAYDLVDHKWLVKMMRVHRFPEWVWKAVRGLCLRWKTRIMGKTKQGNEMLEVIKGLPQGDALCLRLFTICLNPVAWKMKSTEGYRLSKPISTKITDLLYIDDLVFVPFENKLATVLKSMKLGTRDVGMEQEEMHSDTYQVRYFGSKHR